MLGLALLGASGIFLGSANPVAQLPPLALFFPACLAILAGMAPTGKSAFYNGWLCAGIGYSACLYWISVPVHDYGNVMWIFAVPCALALGGYLGLYGGLFCLAYRAFRSQLPFGAALLLAAPLWTALDTIKGWLFSGFPWVSLSTAFLPWTDWVQAAAFIGADGLSGSLALAAIAVAEARPVRAGFAPRITPKKKRLFCYCAAVASLGLVYCASFASPLPEGREVTVGLIQGNVDQNQKWVPAYQAGTLDRYLALSEWTVNPHLGKVNKSVDLLVWPETAMPFYLESNPAFAAKIAGFSREFSVPIILGAPGKGAPGELGYYNRMWLQTPDVIELQRYDKNHLVPFGEYVPFDIPLPFIEYLMQGVAFIPGETQKPLVTGDLALGALICYEAVFPDIARKRVAKGANLLVNISNDAWFGRTSAPVQHLHLAAMRAIEQGRYLVRSTNTGISAVVTPRGKIAFQGSIFRAEAIVGAARLVQGFTVYHSIAPHIALGTLCITLAGVAYCFAQRRKQRSRAA